MRRLLWIAGGQWRYWLRSNLAVGGAVLFAVLLSSTAVLTASRMEDERRVRHERQDRAEETFLAQPDRHPHRMVHYGHYVFRTPPPLAVFDPGLEPVTGRSIFLEGHRQNSAMFAETATRADLGGLPWLTPAVAYQIFAPLLIVLLGHGAMVRERESSALASLLAQGVSGRELLGGKALALASVIGILLSPIVPTGIAALSNGEDVLAVLSLLGVYLLYFLIWGAMTLLASASFSKRSVVLTALASTWLAFTIVVPAAGVNVASREMPAGKIETDLVMLADLRRLGDGHDANDPAFAQLRASLLQQHGVEKVEDLPVNLRGIVAEYSEERLTKTMNAYAEARMVAETRQSARFARSGWWSPTVAVGAASRSIAGTDLEHHHRFLREAERLRYDLVQALNRVHAEQLSYVDDIHRSSDAEAERRTRVAAENWAVLEEFRFAPAAAPTRLESASPSIARLACWLLVLVVASDRAGRRIEP